MGDSYVLDDRYHILPLAPATGLGDWLASVSEPWWSIKGNTLWRPLTRLAHVLQKTLSHALGFGDAPTVFRCFSLVLHAVSCWLAFRLARALRLGSAGAGFAGLLLAVHPLRSEGVHQIVGQAEVLGSIFMLSGLLVYLRQRCDVSRPARLAGAQAGFCLLALASKENAVVYPMLVLLMEGAFIRSDAAEPDARPGALRNVLALTVAFLGSLALFFLGKWVVTGGLFPDVGLVREHENALVRFGFLGRLPAVAGIFAHVMLKSFFPTRLSPDYSAISFPFDAGWAWSLSWAGVLIVILLLAAALLSFYHRGRLWALILGGFCAYAVTSNLFFLIGVSTAGRLWYFPVTALAIGVGAAWERLESWMRFRFWDEASPLRLLPRLLMAVLVIMLLSSTWSFAPAWRSNIQFSERTLEVFPRNWRAHINLSVYAFDQKRYQDGLVWARKAAEIWPENPKSWHMVGLNAREIPGHATEASEAFARARGIDMDAPD